MLQSPSSHVRVCYEHAEWCASQARGALRNEDRQEFLVLAQRWLKLARGYEVAASSRQASTVADESPSSETVR